MNLTDGIVYIDSLPGDPSVFYLNEKGTFHRNKRDALSGINPLEPRNYIVVKPTRAEMAANDKVVGKKVNGCTYHAQELPIVNGTKRFKLTAVRNKKKEVSKNNERKRMIVFAVIVLVCLILIQSKNG